MAISTITELAASIQLANYPAVTAFGVAVHRSQLKARTPLARNAGHSAARSVAKALTLFYRVVLGLVPALPPHQFLTSQKQGRLIRTVRKDDFQVTNIIRGHARHNTRAYVVLHTPMCHRRTKVLYVNETTPKKQVMALPVEWWNKTARSPDSVASIVIASRLPYHHFMEAATG